MQTFEIIQTPLISFNAIMFLFLFMFWSGRRWVNMTIKGSFFVGTLLNSVWLLKVIGII